MALVAIGANTDYWLETRYGMVPWYMFNRAFSLYMPRLHEYRLQGGNVFFYQARESTLVPVVFLTA